MSALGQTDELVAARGATPSLEAQAGSATGVRYFPQADVAAVRAACGPALLKVILESAALTPEQLAEACRRSEVGGAQYVKTSTGFHPAGGATLAAVGLMRETVGDRLGVKASGGIRDTATAIAMLEAGASRLGLSGTRAVLDGLVSP